MILKTHTTKSDLKSVTHQRVEQFLSKYNATMWTGIWIHLAEGKNKGLAVVNTVINLRVRRPAERLLVHRGLCYTE